MGEQRLQQFTDAQRARIQPLLLSPDGHRGWPLRNNRQVVAGIIYGCRAGIAWRDPPDYFGPWQTVWKRHCCYTGDSTVPRYERAPLGQK